MKKLKDSLLPLLRRIFAKHHPLFPDIMINWSKIAGLKFSTTTWPLKITVIREKGQKLNILHVQAENSPIGTEIRFQQEIIMERIAVYLGFRAVHGMHVTVYNKIK